MERKKIVFLMACLLVALVCTGPQVVVAYEPLQGSEQELVVDQEASDLNLEKKSIMAKKRAMAKDMTMRKMTGPLRNKALVR